MGNRRSIPEASIFDGSLPPFKSTNMQTGIPPAQAEDSDGIIPATFRSQPYRVRERQALSRLAAPGLTNLSTSHPRCSVCTPSAAHGRKLILMPPQSARALGEYLSWIIRQCPLSTLHGFTDSTTTGVVVCAY